MLLMHAGETRRSQTRMTPSRALRPSLGMGAIAAIGFLVAGAVGVIVAAPLHVSAQAVGALGEVSALEEEVGQHYLDWNPRVVADASGAQLPQGTRMPCSACHGTHALPTGSLALLVNSFEDVTITEVRDLCVACHLPSDSGEGARTVLGLVLLPLPGGVEAHLTAAEQSCLACHGGSPHRPESHGSGSAACGDAGCHGDSGSHGVHFSATDPHGFGGMECAGCHDTENYPRFASGVDADASGAIELDETDVCDACHSPGGAYNGVESTGGSVGAKDNWETRVYETTSTLQAGKERWCVGCHDDESAEIDLVAAPNIAGDESASSGYGPWGFYATGHGLPRGLYPASEAPAAGLECVACHDYSYAHIDGNQRSYSAAGDNYQSGYRLRSVGGQEPMFVPRSGTYTWVADPAHSRLCFDSGCHDPDLYTDPANMTTNFREEADASPYNSHELHMLMSGGWPNRWDSDWDGTGDSMDNCTSCHNVHGSPSAVMIRHGELISTPGTTDKVPALNFFFTPTSGSNLTRLQSTGGYLNLSGAGGSVTNTGVCSMCHSRAVSYTRVPTDFYPPNITSVSGKVGSNTLIVSFSKGVCSASDGTGDLVAGDFSLADLDDGRTIVAVSHTAGDDLAFVTLSSPLDLVADIDTDSLGAATASSVYSASGIAMGTGATIIEEDAAAPVLSDLDPAHSATGVSKDADVRMTISDAGAGVDWASFSITFTGDLGYSETYTDADTSVVTATGDPFEYEVVVDPDANFGDGEVIAVTVNVSDLLGNALTPPEWTFTVDPTPSPQTMVLYPSDRVSGAWTAVGGGWADVLDVNDGDTSYGYWFTSPGTLEMALDDSGLGSATIVDLTYYVVARHSTSAANVQIGYRTGTNTVWLPATSLGTSYTLLSSPTYTTDSDGGALSVADIESLRLYLSRSTTGPNQTRCTQMYAVVTYIP